MMLERSKFENNRSEKDKFVKNKFKNNKSENNKFEEQHYIDKTEVLERGIVRFPSVFIEGAAASGKTTAIQMLLSKHPDVETVSFFMQKERDADAFCEKLRELEDRMRGKVFWVIFENIQGISGEKAEKIADFIEDLKNTPEGSKVFLLSRECPDLIFLKLLWKGRMELVSADMLNFTKNEVREFIESTESSLNPDEVFSMTGGWAGCVNMMARFAVRQDNKKTHTDMEALRRSYEIDTYIREEIIESLSEEETEIMRRAAVCPWMNQELCSDVWGLQWSGESLEMLGRKGMLGRIGNADKWYIAPLFRGDFETVPSDSFWKRLGNWYDSKNHIKEALDCLVQSGDEKAYKECMTAHFDEVPFLEHDWSAAAQWKDNSLKVCYLRGMHCFLNQNTEGLRREIRKAENQESFGGLREEILINLNFLNPEVSLDDWLELLKSFSVKERRFRLYNVQGGSFSYLCGLRDLSGMFACSKKEENLKARIWQENLGDEEWLAYCQAKMLFYIDTGRWDAVKEEEKTLIEPWIHADSWRIRLGCFYILSKLQQGSEKANSNYIQVLEESLCKETESLCIKNTEAVTALAYSGRDGRKSLAQRLKYVKTLNAYDINEKNYALFCAYARGYVLLNQNEKAENILNSVIPYLRQFKRYRFLAEMLFLRSITKWEKNLHGESLRAMIESFVISGTYRYQQFYVSYDKRGSEVLDAYVQWLRSSAPEGWHRKKKYNYGNILRMPFEDYIESLQRKAKMNIRHDADHTVKKREEHLTMTETIILQYIDMGMSNNEICESLSLKLPTVKNYISSLYKKLEVSNRVQAVNKGKELGILE